MAKLRKGCAYRKLERPYTRQSKFRAKSFIRGVPTNKVTRFEMGNLVKKDGFEYTLALVSKIDVQVRHNALEAARQSGNRILEQALGKTGYFFRVKVYPHHVLRENPLASGAGADRMSTGMAHSFGKPIGIAARVKKGQVLFEACVDKAHLELGKKSLIRAKNKLPCSCTIITNKTA